ncbi:MAG: hypothetical protein ACP5NQ_03605 [Vulcanisaeta sp.]
MGMGMGKVKDKAKVRGRAWEVKGKDNKGRKAVMVMAVNDEQT